MKHPYTARLGITTTWELPATDRANQVLALALEYATEMGHQYIGTEHILVGLLREGKGIGAGVLLNMGIDAVKVEEAVEFILGREK